MSKNNEKDLDAARARSVDRDVAARGITDERVLSAMRSVRRERFVPADLAQSAYDDNALPIGSGQTISQPYIVALMAEAAEISPSDTVLEVGTGSGYGAAVLAELAAEVWTIERHANLAESARRQLRAEDIDNVHVLVGDGTLGWPEKAPYDAIVVTASSPRVPGALREQLAVGGRLILPTGTKRRGQKLVRVRRTNGDYSREDLGLVRFVPLIGSQGWKPDTPKPT
jgi:protein-L-isoaspartate(D-aspartate) O-methyltransferase